MKASQGGNLFLPSNGLAGKQHKFIYLFFNRGLIMENDVLVAVTGLLFNQ